MLNLYTETSFHAKPSTRSSLVRIDIPSNTPSDRKQTPSFTQATGNALYFKDEKTFNRQYLATQSSIYFRQAKTYPRTFLWRVLGDSHTLQIQCADVARSSSDLKEAHLTLSFDFQHKIIPSGVAITDGDKGELLYVFVITAGNELYTLALHTDYFRSSSQLPKDIRQWCHFETPSAFTIDRPHYLHANNPYEVFVSYESGNLQRLSRRSDEFDWAPSNYDERSWGATIRGMVSRRGQRQIEHGSRRLDPATAQAIVASSDSTYVFTVCLNHTLRVWNIATGKLAVSKDLLDQPRHPQDNIRMNPVEPGFLRLVKLDHLNHLILVTYSPRDGGKFKFWDVKGGLTSPLVVEDKYPAVDLSPPDPDPSGNTVWSLTGVEVRPGNNSKPTELWVLWRNNNYHQLYSLHFDFFDLAESWETDWVSTSLSPSLKHIAPDLVRSDAQDVTTKWCEHIYYPGRYPTTVLETALSIYQDAMGVKLSSTQKVKSLQERICSVIAANVTLRKYSESELDYERLVTDTDFQWRNFWRIIESVNDGRQAPVSLSFDVFADMTWVVMADHCCAIRECSTAELLLLNDSESVTHLEEQASERWPHRKVSANHGEPLSRMAALIVAAATFRKSFPADLTTNIEVAIEEELLQEQEYSIPYRLSDFYERVGFGELITNEVYDEVEENISRIGGLSELSNELFFAVCDVLPSKLDKSQSALRNTVFGSSLLSAGMQDTISAHRQLLFDLLVLVVFLEGEMAQEESRSIEFDASELFEHLLGLLKEHDKNLWLASHARLVPLEFLGPSPAPNALRNQDEFDPEEGRVVTILEDAIGKAVRPQPAVDKPQMYLLTHMLGDIEAWIGGEDEISPEDATVYIQCDLIAQGNIDLATDFERFQPPTPWATYVKARLCLARIEYANAAIYFHKSAYSLACGKAVGSVDEMSAGLIPFMDVDCFNSGLPRYFQHVMSLFESSKAYSQASDFARLALSSLAPGQQEPVPNFRSEVLSRLFTAELQCFNFSAAYGALIQFSDIALQKSSMIALLTAMLDPRSSSTDSLGAVQALQAFPLALHPHLARHVDEHLSALAKRQSLIPDTSTQLSLSSNDYLKILHAIRITQGDFRGAVSVLFDRLRLVRKSSRARGDPHGTDLRCALLALINALTCVAPDEAYILAEVDDLTMMSDTRAETEVVDVMDASNRRRKRKRIIVTLDDLRKEYQQLLDRCSRIERGDFDFDMDVESDVEST